METTEYIQFNDGWFTYYYCKKCGHKELNKPKICPVCGGIVSNNSNESDRPER